MAVGGGVYTVIQRKVNQILGALLAMVTKDPRFICRLPALSKMMNLMPGLVSTTPRAKEESVPMAQPQLAMPMGMS